MTCIVGVQGNGVAVIGGDSAAVSGQMLTRRIGSKVFESRGFVYGVAGSFRLADILRWCFDPTPCDGADLDEYMHTTWVNDLRHCVAEHGGRKLSDAVESLDEGAFLVAVRGRLFEVYSDLQVGVPGEGYTAVGSGAEVATGALLVAGGEPEDRAFTALSAAAHHVTTVCRPFVVKSSHGPRWDVDDPTAATRCAGCGAAYPFDNGCDVVMSNADWERVSPNGRVLCAACIARRASQLDGVTALRAALETSIGPYFADVDPDGFMREVRGGV